MRWAALPSPMYTSTGPLLLAIAKSEPTLASAAAAPANGNQTGPLTPEVVKAYLNKHSIEAKLQAAIDKVVAEMPDDPLPFIAAQLTK